MSLQITKKIIDKKNWIDLLEEETIFVYLITEDPDISKLYRDQKIEEICQNLTFKIYKTKTLDVIAFGEMILYHFAKNEVIPNYITSVIDMIAVNSKYLEFEHQECLLKRIYSRLNYKYYKQKIPYLQVINKALLAKITN